MISRQYTAPAQTYASDLDDPKGDPQQSRVYALERGFIGHMANVFLTQKQLQEIADYVCRRAKVPKIKIEVNTSARPSACGTYYPATVFAPARLVLFKYRHGCNAMVLAHEVAHHIHDSMADGNVDAAHGPEFLGIYRRVLHRLNLVPEYAFDAGAKKWKLRVKRFTKVRDL